MTVHDYLSFRVSQFDMIDDDRMAGICDELSEDCLKPDILALDAEQQIGAQCVRLIDALFHFVGVDCDMSAQSIVLAMEIVSQECSLMAKKS